MTRKFDMVAYAKSSATLKRDRPESIRLEPGNRAGLLEHESVTIPGRFVGDALDNWTVSIRTGQFIVPGFSSGESLEVIGSGKTREEAIQKAEAELQRRQEAKQ